MRLRWLGFVLLLVTSSPGLAAWHEAKSKHFVIYSEQSPEELHEYAIKLEKFDRAVRQVRRMQDPPLGLANRLTVYVLRDAEAVARMAGASGSGIAGFYSPRASGSIAFVFRTKPKGPNAKAELTPDIVFFHEYLHHLMLGDTSAALPHWIVEGFAEFFSTASFEQDGSIVLGSPANHRAYGLFYFDDLSLQEMLGSSYQRLTDTERETVYGRGWLLTHYLNFEPTREGQLARYLGGIQRGEKALDSARAAFGDLKQLNRELNKYLRSKTLRVVKIAPAALAIDSISVRTMSAAETAMMPVRMRSDRGVNKRSAATIASDARRIAARFPNDPFVQATLAEAEHDAGNYVAAIAAADRALAADPAYVSALVYEGRARMRLALSEPAKADWKAIRGWFTKANRIDTENPEPLLLFYETFAAAGSRPTANAVAGLLYAQLLVPQDGTLRMLAVRQLLTDNRLAEAKVALTPLAYNPHGSDEREFTVAAMDAIAAGNSTAALAALDQTSEKAKAKKDN